jgi:chondroitin 4-sulfotransferase 11
MKAKSYLKSHFINKTTLLLNTIPFDISMVQKKLYSYLYDKLERQSDEPIYSLNYCHFYKCVFIHIPKTGGVAIHNSLFNSFGGAHYTIDNYQQIIGKQLFNEYFKFSFVRNPWDRLLSAYFFLKKGGMCQQDAQFYLKQLNAFDNFNCFVENWVNSTNIDTFVHFKKQGDFILNKQNKMDLNFLGYYENINHDFEIVKQHLGMNSKNVNLKWLNASSLSRKNYREYYNETTKKIVATVYEKDIDMFKYVF